jgi:uncharacterized protein (DUF1499 family)
MTPEEASTYLGIQHDGGLSPCPQMPNAVCSYFPKDQRHFLEPIRFEGSEDSAKERLKAIMASLSGTSLVTDDGAYLHFEFRTFPFGKTDDVEFLIDEEKHTIHFRSASREGYWDLGKNSRRMKKIKDLFRSIQV